MSGQVVRVFRFPIEDGPDTTQDEADYPLPEGWEPVGAETFFATGGKGSELLIFAVRSQGPDLRVA